MPYPIPECEITFNLEAGCYGYTFRFAGRNPHYQLETCNSLESALASVDPHHEMIWEEPSDADESRVLVSRSYKGASVLDRMTAR